MATGKQSLVELRIEDVMPYIWPHFEHKNSTKYAAIHPKCCAYKHGEQVTIGNEKYTFRIIEAGLYRDDWMAKALPLAKEYWENRECQNKA